MPKSLIFFRHQHFACSKNINKTSTKDMNKTVEHSNKPLGTMQ